VCVCVCVCVCLFISFYIRQLLHNGGVCVLLSNAWILLSLQFQTLYHTLAQPSPHQR